MPALDALRRGDVSGALAELREEVKASPSDSRLRVFLFQLLSVVGEWDKALAQLGVAAELDPAAGVMAKAYQEILRCEALRREVFAGKRTPVVLGEPSEWVALLIEALAHEARGDTQAAADLRGKAFEMAPESSGQIATAADAAESGDEDRDAPSDPQGTPFAWIADGDGRLGPVLEVIVNGKYAWAPFDRISLLRVDPPADLRDLVWAPVHFTWSTGGESVGVTPTRYPGAESHEDDAVKMARKTEWQDDGHGAYRGVGQRVLVTDLGEHPLLETRLVRIDQGDAAVA